MDAVNLLPLEYRVRKRRRSVPGDDLNGRRTLKLGGLVTAFFVLLLGGLYYHEHSVVQSKQKTLADDRARIESIRPQVEAIKEAQAATVAKLGAAQSLTASRMNWDRALNDFARVIPTNTYLTSLQVAAPVPTASSASTTAASGVAATTTTPATTGAPSGLTIGGVAPTTPGVALVMDRLALLPWLSNVSLASATLLPGNNTYTFNLGASVAQER